MPTTTTTNTTTSAAGTTTETTTVTTPEVASANADVVLCQTMVGEWGAGTLAENKGLYFADSCVINAGEGSCPGFRTYTMATFDTWMGELGGYDFPDMTWEFSPFPGGCIAEWTVSSLVQKASGKASGPVTAHNTWKITDGLITDMVITKSVEVEKLFSDAVSHVQGIVGDWGAGKLKDTKATFFAPDATIDGGLEGVPGFTKYTMATFDTWMDELLGYDFNDMAWTFYMCPGGAIGEWTVSSIGVKSTGKVSGPMAGINKFTLGADGMVASMAIMSTQLAELKPLL